VKAIGLEFCDLFTIEPQRMSASHRLGGIVHNVTVGAFTSSGTLFSRYGVMIRESKVFGKRRLHSDGVVVVFSFDSWRRAAILPKWIERNLTHLETIRWLGHDLGIEIIKADESPLHGLQGFSIDAIRFDHCGVLQSGVVRVIAGDADQDDRTRCLNPYWCFSELAASAVLSALAVGLFVYGGAAIDLPWWWRVICWIGCLICVALSWRITHFALDYHCWFG
jgi:hypothetical protein